MLVLSFADGSSLRCAPHPKWEAWEVAGGSPTGIVVCTPGGDLAVFDSSHVPTADETQQAVDRLNEMMGWNQRVQRITDKGGIIVSRDMRPHDDVTEAKDT